MRPAQAIAVHWRTAHAKRRQLIQQAGKTMKLVSALISAVFAGSLLAGMAEAQVGPSGAAPVPGSGDSTKISNGNRESQSNYNHLLNAGDPKPADSADKPKSPGKAVPAAAADIKAGSSLRDSQGVKLGTIDSVDDEGAVVNTGQTKIKVPLAAFGKDDQGLLLGITAARFNELVAKAKGSN
jgi:hypothetical protein